MTLEALAYENKPRVRRWSARGLIIIAFAAAAVVAWKWRSVASNYVDLYRSRIALARYALPADSLVWRSNAPVGRVPKQWTDFYRACDGGTPGDSVVLYLGDRSASAGRPRLVEVGLNPHFQTGRLVWHTFDVPTIARPTELSGHSQSLLTPTGKPLEACTLYSAVADPADGSHFAFRYADAAATRYVDGYLMPDGTIRLEARPASSR